MYSEEGHISDQDLLLAADGELSTGQEADIQAHLAACWACRTRMREIESTIAEFVQARPRLTLHLPPADGARDLLKARMAELAAAPHPNLWQRIIGAAFERRLLALACVSSAAVLLGIIMLRSYTPVDESWTNLPRQEARAIPDPSLTPGATLPVTKECLCAAGMTDTVRFVPSSLAQQVFAAYGIRGPEPGAYELDYLITPGLGGADNIRNFWPQPYGTTAWNAHIKDALEEQLYHLVCAGKLDLATAQRDIAHDWVSAYKKYFHTNEPLPEHVSFLKDRPWG
jgi:hypothetical protein